jgi:hypothetical protein
MPRALVSVMSADDLSGRQAAERNGASSEQAGNFLDNRPASACCLHNEKRSLPPGLLSAHQLVEAVCGCSRGVHIRVAVVTQVLINSCVPAESGDGEPSASVVPSLCGIPERGDRRSRQLRNSFEVDDQTACVAECRSVAQSPAQVSDGFFVSKSFEYDDVVVVRPSVLHREHCDQPVSATRRRRNGGVSSVGRCRIPCAGASGGGRARRSRDRAAGELPGSPTAESSARR